MTRQEIWSLVIEEQKRLGTNAAIANKLGVSPATISQVVNRKWKNVTEKMWLKLAAKLDYNPTGWQIVETLNSRMLNKVYDDAKKYSLWIAIAHRAGGGKTATARAYYNSDGHKGVYYLACGEWNRRQFVVALAKSMGIDVEANKTCYQTTEQIANFLIQRRSMKPVVILDEADKLTQGAIRCLITIYNQVEDECGFIIQGTENLEVQFLRGIKHKKKGYDELMSRFGRRFVRLFGANKTDVANICKVNGINDPKKIANIWKECSPAQVQVGNKFMMMINDLRKLKRAVRRELMIAGVDLNLSDNKITKGVAPDLTDEDLTKQNLDDMSDFPKASKSLDLDKIAEEMSRQPNA